MKIIGQVKLWMLLCLFGLSQATETACSAALPNIAKSFKVDGNYAQLNSSMYFIGFAVGILSLGRVSDIFGRRPIILTGLTIYIAASVASIFATDINILITLRFCQAFGASVGSVIGQAMARDSYKGSELSYIYASLSMGLALIPSIGSTMGGYIVEYFGWRYIFLTLSIISSILLMLYAKLLPETNPYIGLSRNNRYLSVLKVVIRDKIVLLYAFIIGSFNGMAFGFYMEAPFIFIDKIGMAPSSYGKLAFLLTIANVFGSLSNRYMVRKHVDSKKIMTGGLASSLIGCTLLMIFSYTLKYDANKYLITAAIFIPMMMHIVGHSFLLPLSLRYALEDYSKVTGTAGSVFGFLYYILVAVISYAVSKLHNNAVINFTVLFFTLSLLSSISFYLILKWQPLKKKYEFN